MSKIKTTEETLETFELLKILSQLAINSYNIYGKENSVYIKVVYSKLNVRKMQLTCYSMGSLGIFGLFQSSLHLAGFVVVLCPESRVGTEPRPPQQDQEFPGLTVEVLG